MALDAVGVVVRMLGQMSPEDLRAAFLANTPPADPRRLRLEESNRRNGGSVGSGGGEGGGGDPQGYLTMPAFVKLVSKLEVPQHQTGAPLANAAVDLFKQMEQRGDGRLRFGDFSSFLLNLEMGSGGGGSRPGSRAGNAAAPGGGDGGGVGGGASGGGGGGGGVRGLPRSVYGRAAATVVDGTRAVSSVTLLPAPVSKLAVTYEGGDVVQLFLVPSAAGIAPGVDTGPDAETAAALALRAPPDVPRVGPIMDVPGSTGEEGGIRGVRAGVCLRHHTAYRGHWVLALVHIDGALLEVGYRLLGG